MSRRAWSIEEDRVVLALVQQHGTKNWAIIAHQLQNNYKFKERSGKQCRQRYHNHLDPKINKKKWTPEEEFTMFQKHKEYGNKWTQIAQHLSGRTDNTIKNHFYSTIRRSLRRMSKLVGSKNSTQKMKYIKPSTLSKIFSIGQKSENDDSNSHQNWEDQIGYQQLYMYIKNNCSSITETIMEFSNFKPKGRNWNLQKQDRQKFQDVIQKMVKINQIYERIRKQMKRNNPHKIIADSSDGESNSQNSEIQDQNPHLLNFHNTTRSKREVKPPKKFQLEQHMKKNAKKKQTKSITVSQKQRNSINSYQNQKKFRNPFVFMQYPQAKKQENSHEQFENENDDAQVEKQYKKNQQPQPMGEQQFQQQQRFLIEFKEEEYNPPYNSSLAHSPGYFFNTPTLAYQTPSGGLLEMIHFNPLFPNQLEDVTVNLKRQIDNKLSAYQQKKYKHQAQIPESQSHKSFSGRSFQSGSGSGSGSGPNINTSPNSSFKYCQ